MLCSFTFGEAVKWGTRNLLDDPGECCRQCREFKPATDNELSCNSEEDAIGYRALMGVLIIAAESLLAACGW